MQSFMRDLLECPACRGALAWRIEEQRGDQIETGAAQCWRCGASYPLRDGIGLFLAADTRGEDLWEEARRRASAAIWPSIPR